MGDDQVQQFVGITGGSDHTARFYLESTGGDLEAAIAAFYDNGGAEAPSGGPPSQAPAAPAPGPTSMMAELAAARAARAAAAAEGAGPSGGGTGGSRRAGGSGRPAAGNVRSLGDIGRDEESEEEDDHNDYYVGGEKSGQVVRGGPPKKRGEGGDEVEDIFERARGAGAEEGRYDDMHPEAAGGGFRSFMGTGRTLAGGEVAAPQRPAQPSVRAITIAFYRNGIFTVDDGEPRGVSDPANAEFMQAIMHGQCPPELDPGDPNVPVNVNLVRRDEDYTPPAQPRHKAFAGTAHKLTDDSGSGASTSAAAAAAAAAPSASLSLPWEGADQSKPLTSIQLRLADGSRMVAEFNLDHTVADIRRFIRASRPDMPTAYRLSTAFPPQQLEDDSASIQAAGLANSVIIQRM